LPAVSGGILPPATKLNHVTPRYNIKFTRLEAGQYGSQRWPPLRGSAGLFASSFALRFSWLNGLRRCKLRYEE